MMHANHAIHDVKSGRLRGRDARKIKESGGTVYLWVKGLLLEFSVTCSSGLRRTAPRSL